MQNVPSGAWEQVERYLGASTPPCDFAALHAAHAPEALLICGNALQRRSELTAAQFVAGWRRQETLLPHVQAGPRFELVEALDWQADDEGGCLLAVVSAGESEQLVTAAFRLIGEAFRVYGACLHDGPLPEPARLAALCLAELAHWQPHARFPVWPVTGLALAYHRLHGTLDLPLLSLPEARFTCQGRGDCCEVVRILLTTNANTERALKAMPWDAIGATGPALFPAPAPAQTPPALWQFVFAGDADGECFAKSAAGCSVHHALGWQPIDPCMQYPFIFTPTPDGICVTASFTCQTVAENQGELFSERTDDLRQRLQPVRDHQTVITAPVALVPGGAVVTWAAYRVIENRLLAVLADPNKTVRQNLVFGSRLMMALLRLPADDGRPLERQDVMAAWQGALPPFPDGDPAVADALVQEMLRSTGVDQPDALLGGGRRVAWDASRHRQLGPALDDALLTRYLRTILFRKTGLTVMGVAFLWAMTTWVYRLWQSDTLYRSDVDGVPPDQALQLGTVRRIEMAHLHSQKASLLRDPSESFAPQVIRPETWASLLLV